jgi:hypothetical protein
MADAGDLKSPAHNWACGFESHLGYNSYLVNRVSGKENILEITILW